MTSTTTRISTLGLTAALWATLVSACGRDDYYIVFERVELRGTERTSAGGGCSLVLQGGGPFGSGTGSSGGGSADGDLTIAEGNQGDGYQVVVTSQGVELARRNYNRAFLLSHDVDTFEVTTRAGNRFEFSYRGSGECDLPPLADRPDGGP